MRGIDATNSTTVANYSAVPPQINTKRRSAEPKAEKQAAPETAKAASGDVPKAKTTEIADFVEKNAKDEKGEDSGQQKQNVQAFVQQQIQQQPDKETIEKANTKLKAINKKFEFSIHDGTNQIVVKVKDSETDEIIREIPSEKVLDILANICEVAGLLVDEKR